MKTTFGIAGALSPWQFNVKKKKNIHGKKKESINVVRVDPPALQFKTYYYSKLCGHILTIQNNYLLHSLHIFINKAFVKLLLISHIRIYKFPWSLGIVCGGSHREKLKDTFSWRSRVQVYTLIPCFFIWKRRKNPSKVIISVIKFIFL